MLKLDKSALDDELYKSLDTADRVKKRLEAMGIKEPRQPDSELPVVPGAIEQLSDIDLGTLYAQILEHFNFVSAKLADAQNDKMQAGNQLTFIKDKLGNDGIKNIQTDSVYLHVLRIKQEAAQTVNKIEALKSILSKQMSAVSRNVEIRKLEWEKNRRYDGILPGPRRRDVRGKGK